MLLLLSRPHRYTVPKSEMIREEKALEWFCSVKSVYIDGIFKG